MGLRSAIRTAPPVVLVDRRRPGQHRTGRNPSLDGVDRREEPVATVRLTRARAELERLAHGGFDQLSPPRVVPAADRCDVRSHDLIELPTLAHSAELYRSTWVRSPQVRAEGRLLGVTGQAVPGDRWASS